MLFLFSGCYVLVGLHVGGALEHLAAVRGPGGGRRHHRTTPPTVLPPIDTHTKDAGEKGRGGAVTHSHTQAQLEGSILAHGPWERRE